MQAKSSWNWCSSYGNFAASQGRGRILLNMDESFVPYFLTDKAVNVAITRAAADTAQPPPAQNITRSQQRLGLTLVAVIAQSIEIQRLLPQLMLLGARSCSRRQHRVVQQALPHLA